MLWAPEPRKVGPHPSTVAHHGPNQDRRCEDSHYKIPCVSDIGVREDGVFGRDVLGHVIYQAHGIGVAVLRVKLRQQQHQVEDEDDKERRSPLESPLFGSVADAIDLQVGR